MKYIEKIYKIKVLKYLNKYEIQYLNKSLFQIREILFIKKKSILMKRLINNCISLN